MRKLIRPAPKDLEVSKGQNTQAGNGHEYYHGTSDSDLGETSNLDGNNFGGQHGGRQNTQSAAAKQNLNKAS